MKTHDDHFLRPHGRDAEILGHGRLAGLSLYDMQYVPVRLGDWHAHQGLVLELPLMGGYDEDYQHTHRHCAPGRLQFYAPEARHISVGGPEATRIFHVLMPISGTPRTPIGQDALLTASPFVAALFVRFTDVDPQRDDGSDIAGALVDAITRAAGAHAGPAWLEEARHITHERYAESIGLRDIAGEVGVNASHLGRTFRTHWGCSIGEYLRRVRVAMATELLIATDKSLLDTALVCGFADQSHFCREFTRLVTISPGRFRRRLRQVIEEGRPTRQSA